MGKFEVKPQEAAILEGIEQRENARKRFFEAMKGVPPKRREKYKKQIGMHTAKRFNDQQLSEATLKKVYAYNAGNVDVADPMVRGDMEKA